MRVITIFYILVLLLSSAEASAKNYYRFKNSQGKLVVKDYLPEYALRNGYEVLNGTGRLIKTIPAELSPKEKQRQKLIEQKLQEKHQAERKKRQKDILLLRQYSDVDAIERSKQSQTSTLNTNIRIVKAHTTTLEEKLALHQKRAADFERQGRKVPKYVLDEISTISNQITANKQSINRYQGQVNRIEARFKNDSIRFQELKAKERFEQSQEIGLVKTKNNIYLCKNTAACDKAWERAQVFAQKNASHPLTIVTDSLLTTGKALNDHEHSLTITRLPENRVKSSMNIVFFVDCFKSAAGKEKCSSSDIQNLHRKFIAYLSK